MKSLEWHYVNKSTRIADGHYPNWWYELVREDTNAWTALFRTRYGKEEGRQCIGQGSFAQARKACITHHNHKGY